jgi:apolipoprotein D and lipocalin family protein
MRPFNLFFQGQALTVLSKAWVLWLILMASLTGCTMGPPKGVSAVTPFDVSRYTGVWFEIARLDHRFERGLTDIHATYKDDGDGSLSVINRGFNSESNTWQEAVGRAFFLRDKTVGSLKVSFFGPFYGGYHVVALDQKDYRWSLVMGPDRDYFWILARDRHLSTSLKAELLSRVRGLGISEDQLIWTPQERTDF